MTPFNCAFPVRLGGSEKAGVLLLLCVCLCVYCSPPRAGLWEAPPPLPSRGPLAESCVLGGDSLAARLALQIVFAVPCVSPISYSHTEAPGGPEGRLEAGGKVLYGALASRLGGSLPTPRENKVCSPGGILRLSDFILLGKGF